jgi:hypothetical protein
MTAAAYATGTIDNCASAGKKTMKKCGAGKGGKSIGSFAIFVVVGVVLFIIIMIISHVISRRSQLKSSRQQSLMQNPVSSSYQQGSSLSLPRTTVNP